VEYQPVAWAECRNVIADFRSYTDHGESALERNYGIPPFQSEAGFSVSGSQPKTDLAHPAFQSDTDNRRPVGPK
jgi:hypothetical protein